MFKKENIKITIPSIIIFITTTIMMMLEVQNPTPTNMKWYELIIAIVELTSTHYLAYQIGKKRKTKA